MHTVTRLACRAATLAAGLLLLSRPAAAKPPGSPEAELVAAFRRGVELSKQGKLAEAVRNYERAAELAPQVYGADHLNTSSILHTLAARYADQGRLTDAERLFRRSLAIRESKLGKDDPAVADVLANLGLLCQRLGHYEESETHLRRALAIRVARLGNGHEYVLESRNNLAMLFAAQARYPEAACSTRKASRPARRPRGRTSRP